MTLTSDDEFCAACNSRIHRNKGQTYLVIPAAGKSARMQSGGESCGKKKQYMKLGKGTVLSQSVKAVVDALADTNTPVSLIAIAHGESEDESTAREALYADPDMEYLLKGVKVLFVKGGRTRQESVYKALQAINDAAEDKSTVVLVHDAARPFVSAKIVKDVVAAAMQCGAAVPAIPVTDTVAETEADEGTEGTNGKHITRHIKRDVLCALQTPQGFRFDALLEAHKKASDDGVQYTDDSEIYNKYTGAKTAIVAGNEANKKITYPDDIKRVVEFIETTPLSPVIARAARVGEEQTAPAPCCNTRVGLGYDSHRLVEGRPLMLGGVEIPSEKGEAGHSDGDALLHAITDALLGASHLGDIGQMFPPSDDKWKGAHSIDLLKMAWKKVAASGWELVNIDCVIKLEKPRLLPHREKIIHSIAAALGVADERVFVCAKTAEGMGEVGRGEAVEVAASCLLASTCRPYSPVC